MTQIIGLSVKGCSAIVPGISSLPSTTDRDVFRTETAVIPPTIAATIRKGMTHIDILSLLFTVAYVISDALYVGIIGYFRRKLVL